MCLEITYMKSIILREPTPIRAESAIHFRNVSWRAYNRLNHSYLSIGNQSANMENYRCLLSLDFNVFFEVAPF